MATSFKIFRDKSKSEQGRSGGVRDFQLPYGIYGEIIDDIAAQIAARRGCLVPGSTVVGKVGVMPRPVFVSA